MSQIQNHSKEVQYITSSLLNLLRRILKEIDHSLKGKRKIMYSDIINLIIREDYRGKMFNEIILLCNYKIKQENYNKLIEQIVF